MYFHNQRSLLIKYSQFNLTDVSMAHRPSFSRVKMRMEKRRYNHNCYFYYNGGSALYVTSCSRVANVTLLEVAVPTLYSHVPKRTITNEKDGKCAIETWGKL